MNIKTFKIAYIHFWYAHTEQDLEQNNVHIEKCIKKKDDSINKNEQQQQKCIQTQKENPKYKRQVGMKGM